MQNTLLYTVRLWEKKFGTDDSLQFRQNLFNSGGISFGRNRKSVYDAKHNIKKEDIVLVCVLKDDD